MSEAPDPILTAIVPVRNRGGVRLENCLRSLAWQQLDLARSLELLVVHIGSDSRHQEDIASLCARYEATLVRVETDEVWNRSRALNFGIRVAKGDYVFCTDADMVFSPNFVQAILSIHAESAGAMVVSRCYDLPSTIDEVVHDLDGVPRLLDAATIRLTSGTGACQSATRTFFEAVQGYDEAYIYWGAEDNDMITRALGYGLELRWVHQHAIMMHQWHPTSKRPRLLSKERFWIRRNKIRYQLTGKQVIKNDAWWGRERS